MKELPSFDRSAFQTSSHGRVHPKPWGWELHWTPEELPYTGKLLHIHAGARLSLQVHGAKIESWLLLNGRAMVVWEDCAGNLVETELALGRGYSCGVGQMHRLVGITECEVIEVSTPEAGTTWRIEDDYGRPHETPEVRERERGAPLSTERAPR